MQIFNLNNCKCKCKEYESFLHIGFLWLLLVLFHLYLNFLLLSWWLQLGWDDWLEDLFWCYFYMFYWLLLFRQWRFIHFLNFFHFFSIIGFLFWFGFYFFCVHPGLICDFRFDLACKFFGCHLIFKDGKGIVGSINVVNTSIPFASAIHNKQSYFLCHQVHILYINSEPLEFFHLTNLVLSCEELDEPPVDEVAWLVCSRIWLDPFEVKIVPKLQVSISLVGLCELLQDRLESSDIVLELSVNVEVLQITQFLLQFFPIFQDASHMDIDDSTSSSKAGVVEVFLAGVHDECSREHGLEESSAAEIALELLNYLLHGVFLDLFDHALHERHPVVHISIGYHDQLLLAGMFNKGISKLFGIVVNVFAEPDHDHHPYLVRLDLYVAVVHICLVEGAEETIVCLSCDALVLHVGGKFKVLT